MKPRALRSAAALVGVAALLIFASPVHAADAPARPRQAAAAVVAAVLDRLALAIPVAAAKRVSGAPVDDPVREASAADAFVALVTPLGIDPAAGRAVITAQFEASKVAQRALLAQWAARPSTIPAGAPPDLVTQVRPAIDSATGRLVTAIADACRAHGASPAGWAAAVDAAVTAQRPRWRWQRQSLDLALAPLREHPCPRAS